MFVFIGTELHADWLGGQLALDEKGYVRTGLVDRSDPSSRAAHVGDGAAWRLRRRRCAQRFDQARGLRSRQGGMAVRLVHEHLEDVGGAFGR